MTKKKKIIGAACVVLAAAVVGGTYFNNQNKPQGIPVSTFALESMTLANTVSLTGTVQSEDGQKVYSTLVYPVEAVEVEVGDIVKAGDVLAQLKDDDLKLDIQQQQVAIDVAQKQSQHAIDMSEKAYANAQSDYENNLNSNVLNAESSVKNATAALSDAQENYRIARNQAEGKADDARSNLHDAEIALDEAQAAYNNATASIPQTVAQIEAAFAPIQADYTEASRLHELDKIDANTAIDKAQKDYDISKSDADLATLRATQDAKKIMLENFSQIQANFSAAKSSKDQSVSAAQSQASSAASAVNSARSGINSAEAAYDAAKDALNAPGMAQSEQAIDSAKRSTRNAEEMKEATHNATQEAIDSAKDSVVSSQLSAEATRSQEVGLQKLQKTLNDTKITAPVDGMITAVYAKIGQPGNGLLFVIENTESLKVATKIKEYDIANVKEGMPVTIKSDGTGEAETPGTVAYIAPVAAKSADGSTQTGTTVEFETDVQVAKADTGLKIGMNARLSVLLEEKADVFGVPYDSIVALPDGSSVLYTAAEGEGGIYTVKAVPVTTGMESDFYIEVLGEGLKAGMHLITNPANMIEGQQVIPDYTIAGASTVGMSGQTPPQGAAQAGTMTVMVG